jgi:hypothetical protein
LKFADRAKNVLQRVKINEFSARDDKVVDSLRSEIAFLKDLVR